MAVVNGEVGNRTWGRNIEAERSPPQQTSDQAEQRIRGESDNGGLSRPLPEGGHARVDLPFPTSSWPDNHLLHQQQQLSSTTATPLLVSRSTTQPSPPQQLKHRPTRSNSRNRRPRTAVLNSTLPPKAPRYHHHHRHRSSSHHLLQHTNGTSTSAATTTPTITTSPILVSKKSIVGHSWRVTKRYRFSRMRRVKRQEYKKLRQMVPALQEKNKVSKVVVIEEAIKYIDELHSALVQRFKSRDIPTTFNGVHLDPKEVHGGNIRELIRRLLANANPNSLPPARIENVRTLPSFLQKLGRHKKS